MNPSISLIREIDALLPQTQCGLCGHRDGCLPYAKSIAEGEEANKCVPGGQPVADA
ncbi:(Fe-S)-binding protein, partial [Acinetobacter baumannii]